MPEAWIGAGGWSYFQGAPGPRLRAYAQAFRFVELNASFYRHPSILDARRWRASVPDDFHFAVKGHYSITHRERFRATRPAVSALARDSAIATALGADILVLEAPADLEFGREETAALKEFSDVLGGKVRIALEPRAYAGRRLPVPLARALRDVGGIDVVDVSRGDSPRVGSDMLYTRLFGKGPHNVWEFSDDELRQIDAAATSWGSTRMVFAFHGVRMYKDAARFVEFVRSGRAPPATRGRGVKALEEVLCPDVTLPASKEALIRLHGWKAIAVEGRGNIHASQLLRTLPSRTFSSLHDVTSSIRL